MVFKEFHLIGTVRSQSAKIEVQPSDHVDHIKSDLAGIFAICDPKGITLHESGTLLTTADVMAATRSIGLKVDGCPIREPYAPRELPFFGNHFEIYPDHMGNHERLFARFGSVIRTANMSTTNYLTNDPRVSEAALSESDYFTKATSDPSHPLYYMRDETALFMCDTSSPAFHIAHKFIPPSMTPNAVRQYTGNMQQAIQESFSVFDELDRQGRAFHVYQYMFKLAGQIIYRIVLGLDVGHFKDIDTPAHEIIRLLGEYMSLMKKTSLSPRWHGYLPFGNHRRLAEVKRRAWALVDEAIDKAAPGGDGGKDAPIQAAALDSTCIADYLKRAVDENGEKLPAEYRLANVVVLIGAGFVTSASLLSWMVYALTKYPGHHQERLLQELVDHAGGGGGGGGGPGRGRGRAWTHDEINALPFLDGFVKETHRLHNPSFQTARNTRRDVIVPGGWRIPARSVVIPTFPSIHRNKDHWENPERFDPDRWAGGGGRRERHRLAFTPFAAGPRGCVGFNVAKLEAKLALANLVYRYHFEDASTEAMEYDPEFLVIRPLNCYVRARRRTTWPEARKKE
ncbi:hypothetical protein V2A60_006482 [Cordyceps javanica]